MRQHLTDLGHDLREKRLLPVAVLMALALFAVPVFLLKRADEPAPPPPVPSAAAGNQTALVSLSDVEQQDSKLETFDAKDPFAPKGGSKGAASSKALVPTSTLPGGSPAGGSPVGDDAAGGAVSAASAGGSGSSGASGSPSSGSGASGGGGGGSGNAPVVRRRTSTRTFTYVADIRFGRAGEERTRRGIDRMTVLPNSRKPLLVVLGVEADRKRIVLLVDSTLSHSGEGTCRPSVRRCTFLYLSLDEDRDEHFVTDSEGTEYGIQLTRIREKTLRRRAASSRRAGASRSSSATGAVRSFHFPLFPSDVRRTR